MQKHMENSIRLTRTTNILNNYGSFFMHCFFSLQKSKKGMGSDTQNWLTISCIVSSHYIDRKMMGSDTQKLTISCVVSSHYRNQKTLDRFRHSKSTVTIFWTILSNEIISHARLLQVTGIGMGSTTTKLHTTGHLSWLCSYTEHFYYKTTWTSGGPREHEESWQGWILNTLRAQRYSHVLDWILTSVIVY